MSVSSGGSWSTVSTDTDSRGSSLSASSTLSRPEILPRSDDLNHLDDDSDPDEGLDELGRLLKEATQDELRQLLEEFTPGSNNNQEPPREQDRFSDGTIRETLNQNKTDSNRSLEERNNIMIGNIEDMVFENTDENQKPHVIHAKDNEYGAARLPNKRSADNISDNTGENEIPASLKSEDTGENKNNKSRPKVLVAGERKGDTVQYTDVEKIPENEKSQINEKSVLILSDAGTYLTKPEYYRSFGKGLAEEDKIKAFAEEMKRYELDGDPYAGIKPERLAKGERQVEIDGVGSRPKGRNYAHPEQAGVGKPDLLGFDKENGDAVGIYITENGRKSIEAVKTELEDVRIKTKAHNYVDIKTYNDRNGPNAAQKHVARLAGETFHSERGDQPRAFYETSPGIYVDKDKYDELKKAPETKNLLPNREKTKILFQAPSGRALVSANTARFLDSEGFQRTLANEKLPSDYRSQRDWDAPEAMVYLKDQKSLVSADIVRKSEPHTPLDKRFPEKDIYIQNVDRKGELNGNFLDMDNFSKRHGKNMTEARAMTSGISDNRMAQRASAEVGAIINNPERMASEIRSTPPRNIPDRVTEAYSR